MTIKKVKIIVAALFIVAALLGAVIVAAHSPADCIDTVTVIGGHPYVNASCQ